MIVLILGVCGSLLRFQNYILIKYKQCHEIIDERYSKIIRNQI